MDSYKLREHLFRVQNIHTRTSGQMSFRAVPALADEFTDKCMSVFATFNRPFTAAEREDFRSELESIMTEAYICSHRSEVTIAYETALNQPMLWSISSTQRTIAEAYGGWTGQLFGIQPDARPAALAAESPDPRRFRILDVGAGGGRNTLALARRGHPVDAVEMTSGFAESIRAEATRQSLDVRVIEADIFHAADSLRRDYAMILVSEVVSEFRTVEQLRALFELAAQHLANDGLLVLNTFVTQDGYVPDEVVRQCAQQALSTLFTPDEISGAVAGLPLTVLSDHSVWNYEKAHQSDESWPPTYWYQEWATGIDIFGSQYGKTPVDLRWLVYRKVDA